MDHEILLSKTIDFVKHTLIEAEGGHDWWHIQRVCETAKTIGAEEGVDLFIVELGALLHDIADAKFNDGDEEIGPRKAKQFLISLDVPQPIIEHVVQIIRNVSYRGSFNEKNFHSKELAVVQDADRLDAIGAIGIARAFNYGGHKGREIYNPDIPPVLPSNTSEYKNSIAPTINHFYEKLLLLKDKMNTESGRKMAEERHRFMELYLSTFYDEWYGTK
jgi:uncharacterized protein